MKYDVCFTVCAPATRHTRATTLLMPGFSTTMSVRLTRLLPVALIGACLTTTAFAAATKTPTHSTTHKAAASKECALIWRGDVATAQGVVSEVALAWQKAGHGCIGVTPFNTASGLDAVATGSADLAGAARNSDNSAEDANLTFTPVAWDALVLITQASNPISNLTLKQVHDIYYGKITNWSEVGGANAPIDLYAVASPGDGVEYSLRELLYGRGDQSVAAPRLYVNTHQLEAGVNLNPNGLGVATLADISTNPKIKAIPINGVAPNATSVGNGSYVLFTPLYLVSNPRNPKAAKVNEFIAFLQTDAAKAAMRLHAVLPYQDGAALAAVDSARRSKILAEVGETAHPVTRAPAAPAAPEPATTVERVAASSAVNSTMASGQALDRRSATDQASASTNAAGSSKSSGSSHGGGTYTVVKGDTLSSIAKTHSVEVSQLREWNHLKSDNIKLGQTLQVSSN
jgi:phosphate transport system substrate-binding protein